MTWSPIVLCHLNKNKISELFHLVNKLRNLYVRVFFLETASTSSHFFSYINFIEMEFKHEFQRSTQHDCMIQNKKKSKRREKYERWGDIKDQFSFCKLPGRFQLYEHGLGCQKKASFRYDMISPGSTKNIYLRKFIRS
jgi:hypothetical protein